MKHHWLFLLLLIPQLLLAQNDESKYLEGAVPIEDGKVVFKKEFKASHLTQDQIFDSILEWAEGRYNTEMSRVAYTNKEEGQLAVVAEEYIVFQSTFLSLDRSLTKYRITVTVEGSNCEVLFNGFRYEYQSGGQNEPDRYVAEELITDKYALNKKKDKLMRATGKFRKGTIDLVEELTKEIAASLQTTKVEDKVKEEVPVASGGVITIQPVETSEKVTATPPTVKPSTTATVAPTVVAAVPVTEVSSSTTSNALEGYKFISADKIPGNIIKMLSEDWMLVTAGKGGDFNMMTASWGGLGHVFNKPVAICFINPTRHTYKFIEKEDTYTFSFYTEAYRDALTYCGTNSGANTDKVKGSGLTPMDTPTGNKAFKEAWLIIECKKLYAQPMNADLIRDDAIRAEYADKAANKMYIGEITGVWVK